MYRRSGKLVPIDRHPLVLFLIGWSAVVGTGGAISILAGDNTPPTGSLGLWQVDLAWYLLLAAGGATVLAGAWWRDALTGVLLIRAGMWPTGAGACAYAVVLAAMGRPNTAIIITGFGVACLWRAVQISRDMRAQLSGG